MGILVECPDCRLRGGLKRKVCKCGCNVQKASSKIYWVEYYESGSRKREKIGRSKQASENRLRAIQTAKAEGRHIQKNKNAQITLKELRDWYLDLSEVKQKRSYVDIERHIDNFINRMGNIRISDLTMGHIEKFRKQRLTEISERKKRPVKPATINRDVANLRALLNRAVDYSKIETNPVGRIKQLEENNIRERVLSQEEFELLLERCPEHLRGPVLFGFYLPMRQREILDLTWQEIDFKNKFIRLGGQRTKNKTGRVIPMHPRIIDYLHKLTRLIQGGYVFNKRWFDRHAYDKAVKEAGLNDFNFHDLRHCAINNLRLAGNDHYAIKEMSGHKTDIAFQRYNLVTEEEMQGVKWLDQNEQLKPPMDTNMDTKRGGLNGNVL